MNSATQFFQNYAEPEASCVSQIQGGPWSATVVIPLLGESGVNPLIGSICRASAQSRGSFLAIFVVNAREEDSEMHARNEGFLARFQALGFEQLYDFPSIWQGTLSSHLDGVIIDRATPGHRFTKKQGVSLARKIGCDLAAALHSDNRVKSRFIRTTDADAQVNLDYWDEGNELSNEPAAFWYPFTHDFEGMGEIEQTALTLYEISLRYYYLGLHYAKSPYAFHCVGSTLAFSVKAYTQVRGFSRKRRAGEDFYLLDKISKVGQVIPAMRSPILISYRPSCRVPFGTGASVIKISRASQAGEVFKMYHPKSFQCLKIWLETCRVHLEDLSLEKLKSAFGRECELKLGVSGHHLLLLLENLGAFSALERANDSSESWLHRCAHFNIWFDGFKTLQFFHRLRDGLLPNLEYQTALSMAPFLFRLSISRLSKNEILNALVEAEGHMVSP